jgi:hypothetical protein
VDLDQEAVRPRGDGGTPASLDKGPRVMRPAKFTWFTPASRAQQDGCSAPAGTLARRAERLKAGYASPTFLGRRFNGLSVQAVAVGAAAGQGAVELPGSGQA